MLRLLLALLLAAPAALAQSGGINPFVLPGLPASTHEAGVSQALATAPTDNPYVLRHNPAFLADAGERPALRFSANAAPMVFENDDLLIGSSVGSIGIDAGEIGGGSVRIGLGGGYAEYRISDLLVTDAQGIELGTTDLQEREITGGLALGWDGPIHVRVGGGVFARESFETPLDPDAPFGSTDRDRVTTLDIGGAVSYPILRGPSEPNELAPMFELTGAFVQRNLVLSEDFFERGDEFPFDAAPPAEGQTFGGSARAAYIRQLGRRGKFCLVEADVRAESRNASDQSDEVRFGATLVLAETIALRVGRSDTDDANSQARDGIGAEFRIGGLVRAIGAMQESASMLALADRLTTRFEIARWGVNDVSTTYYGLTLGWRP